MELWSGDVCLWQQFFLFILPVIFDKDEMRNWGKILLPVLYTDQWYGIFKIERCWTDRWIDR